MFVRVITLVLAVLMVTATASQVCASPAVASAVDDVPDVDLALPATPQPIAMPEPARREQACAPVSQGPLPGRLHAVFVFRPPR